MEQMTLYHEDIYEAVRTAVQALGGPKKVGSTLWPDKSPNKAGELLSNCLNTTRNEKLDLEQLLFISRQARNVGCHSVADFFSSDCGYKMIPVEPKDELAELQTQYIEAAKMLQKITTKIEHVSLKEV